MPLKALSWTVVVLTFLGAGVFGFRRFVASKVLACQPRALFACADAERVIRPLCAAGLAPACLVLDGVYRVEFAGAALLYASCRANDSETCARLAWHSDQWFRDEPDRRRTAEAARRWCEGRHGTACVALAVYYRGGLGVPVDIGKEARFLEAAFSFGEERYPCDWVEECRRGAVRAACHEEMARRLDGGCWLKAEEQVPRAVPRTDYFYIPDAALSSFNPRASSDARNGYSNEGDPKRDPNSVVGGRGLVLSFRTWDDGRLWYVDDETFEKVSIEVRSYALGTPVDVASPDARFYYAHGARSWSPPMGGDYADTARGTVTILSIDGTTGTMNVRLDVSCQPKWGPTSGYAGQEPDPPAKYFRGDRMFERKGLDTLSPWLGGTRLHPRTVH